MLNKAGWKTYAVGALTSVLAVAGAVDWTKVPLGHNGPEIIAAIGAGIVFGRALKSLFLKMGGN